MDSKRFKQIKEEKEFVDLKELMAPEWQQQPAEEIEEEKSFIPFDIRSLSLDLKDTWRWSKRHRSQEVILTDSFRKGKCRVYLLGLLFVRLTLFLSIPKRVHILL